MKFFSQYPGIMSFPFHYHPPILKVQLLPTKNNDIYCKKRYYCALCNQYQLRLKKDMEAGYLNLSVRAVIFFTESSNHVHSFPLSAPISQSEVGAQKIINFGQLCIFMGFLNLSADQCLVSSRFPDKCSVVSVVFEIPSGKHLNCGSISV